ncbi:MAG: helix-turn-helix transcriptional regulator [Clostridia bacterium]|nr:helix-turn-helix transcriptional regulator [Clostridia bacterium]
MATPNKNFKAVLNYLGITNLELARALGYDPSLISRYLSGHRVLKAASEQMNAIADYILSRTKRVQDIDWLRENFAAEGLPTDVSTVYRIKQNLIMWLATDGETLRRNLGRALPGDIAGIKPATQKSEPSKTDEKDSSVKIGYVELVLALRPVLSALPNGAAVNIFLSNDRLTTATNKDVAALLREMISKNNLCFNMVVCVSGDTKAMSKLLDSYMEPLISGHVKLSVVHGMTQTVTSAMHILIPNGSCFLINETIGTNAPPITVAIQDAAFVAETEKNFEVSARYAQSVLTVYGDAYTRDVIEILAMEYCTPGELDVVKDSINPMFMSCEAYDRFLKTRNHSPEEFAWRSAEFARFKAGMNANLQSGVPFREIISLARLCDIAQSGSCRMAGLYFAELGYVDLDRQGCIDIINGYIDYLANEPNFSLLILDALAELHGNNCWHIKRNGHISINNWQGKEPVMVYSDQLMLLREFQAHYDAMWAQGEGAIGSRANVISILKDVVGRMKQ